MHTWERHVYWLIVGALIGCGGVGAATVGLPFLVVGSILLLYGMIRIGPIGFWAALIGFGTLPPFFILYGDRLYGNRACSPGWKLTIIPDTPGGTAVACGQIPASSVTIALFFASVALAGLLWKLGTTYLRPNRKKPGSVPL